ncbi:MAG: hypothetical protein ABFS56_17360 [Pseudomonadota bacterium]
MPEYVETLASGYGLEPPSVTPKPAAAMPAAVQQTVQGQQLEKVKVDMEKNDNWQWMLILLLFVTVLGYLRQLVGLYFSSAYPHNFLSRS